MACLDINISGQVWFCFSVIADTWEADCYPISFTIQKGHQGHGMFVDVYCSLDICYQIMFKRPDLILVWIQANSFSSQGISFVVCDWWTDYYLMYKVLFCWGSCQLIQGVYPDVLHIIDLQLCHDVIASSLLELSDGASPRDRRLQDLCCSYERWCRNERSMASTPGGKHRRDENCFRTIIDILDQFWALACGLGLSSLALNQPGWTAV